MGKSYVRRPFYREYDPEYDRRYLKKNNFNTSQKHGVNLMVKRGVKIRMCHCGNNGCTEDPDYKEHSKKHYLKQLVTYEVDNS